MIEFKKEVGTLQCLLCGGIEGVKTLHICRERQGDSVTTFDICRHCAAEMAREAGKAAGNGEILWGNIIGQTLRILL